MSVLVHTGSFRIDEFSLAGDAHAKHGYVDLTFDVECYSDGDWDIARIGFTNSLGNVARTWWLESKGSEALLFSAIRRRAIEFYSAEFAEFARLEMEEVA